VGGRSASPGVYDHATSYGAGFSGECPLPSALIYTAVFLDRFSGSQCICVDPVKLLLQYVDASFTNMSSDNMVKLL
jgi:hypothetical protein